MGEVVIRMEMPQSCEECPFEDAVVMFRCGLADRDVKPAGLMMRPSWCPIICQLPEGHGRLVDIDRKFLRVATDGHGMSLNWRGSIADMIDKDNMRGVEIIVQADTAERSATNDI